MIDGLTREQVLAMEPGRESDLLIAKNVTHYVSLTTALNPYGTFGYIPPYSTDISVAFEVVEKMKEKNWWFVLNSEYVMWNAMFYWDPNQIAIEAEAVTAPLAVCRAALLAVMDG